MINRIGIAALWLLGLLFVFVGINKNDPYLVALRGTGNVALVIAGIAVVAVLIRRGHWRRGIFAKLLVLLWCLAPLSMLGAHVAFEARKRDVLQTETAQAHALGRHFVVGYSSFDEVALLAEKGLIAGIYVSRRNLSRGRAEGLKAEISALQERRRRANLPPLTVAADQEGGIVSHLSPALSRLPALATLAGLEPDARAQQAEEFGRIHGRELASLGITTNFAPVLDLRPETKRNRLDFHTLIGQRAISADPAEVAAVALPYVRGLEASGVGATVKHFPGLGRVHDDTHHFSADLDTPLKELEASDWRPFREVLAGSKAQLMVGHVTLTAADPDRPASHSKRVVDGIIRQKWKYDGLVITDDLVMGAIYQRDVCTAVVEALNAGVDLLLVAYDGAQFYRVFACASAGLRKGQLDAGMLRASDARLKRAQRPLTIAGR
ncbi:glycoside hydrolase family 3 protein [Bradyrhizobium lablabi]|uniref:glycoside hydrolase family 3 protein n=1 Tax=Bradyrhizobium lablabi TaxID=722472 RepID=UPI001BAB5EBD|nr:glycoside hydrolase family 3 protein [Bradyrhizobium lablabi]MBR1120014.1 glycoside hydrolase family 3 protein [Bradyrhizobium lablabi]